ncbi:hypothetical protein [Methylobacter sp.]|uniref:hypothetical protein n=1 Tax=Methylobacter sp. TaxID=2051955 RepID=UPI002FDCB690
MNRMADMNRLLERISLFDVRSYLERKGWRLTIRKERWVIFRLEENQESVELVLPSQDHFSDVRERISQTVLSLSQIEGRTTREICSAIIETNTDSLLIRLQIPSNRASIPVEEAPRHVKAINELILFSACSEVDARQHYEKPLSGSSEIMGDFEFCHTFAGSFGFEVSSAIVKPLQTDDLFNPPKARLIIERLARGLTLLDKAVQGNDPEILIQAYKYAFNARMCDAITDIGIDGKVTFNVGIEWASSILPAEDVRSFNEQIISEPQINMLKHVSEQLKIVHPRPDSVSGSVINLHCASNPVEGHSKRSVALKVRHNQYGNIEVKMNLSPEYYLLAIEAHTKGKLLNAIGQLQRKGNVWSVDAITELEIVTD